jgi:sugar (pentulose or hexulose) kinase
MFPIDISAGTYDATMLATFDRLAAESGVDLNLVDLLPEIRVAGRLAGHLTVVGARMLDPTGTLRPGTPMCPPEGDAGTGMVATNSVAPHTGNVSAGTSAFAMIVLERELSRTRREVDLVTTPAGDPVAMVHCNNGASELDAWVGLFAEFASLIGSDVEAATVFEVLLRRSLEGAADGGGLLAYNYLSAEPITNVREGRPLFVRSPDSTFDLATFMRAQLYTSLATLRIGMDVLQREEGVKLERMFAHGGLFRTTGVAQRYLAAAIDTPVSVGAFGAEGGAWGVAVLAAFATSNPRNLALGAFLNDEVFATATVDTIEPSPADVAGFSAYLQRFVAGLSLEAAGEPSGPLAE